MDLSLSGQTSILGGVFFVFKSLLGIERQRKLKKNSFLTRELARCLQFVEVFLSTTVILNSESSEKLL